MTFLLYTAFIVAIMTAAGEVDRLLQARFVNFYMNEHRLKGARFLTSTIASFFMPGAGQYFNGQYMKAAVTLSFPLTIMAFVPRPWQMLPLPTKNFLFIWWLLAILDAFVVGIFSALVFTTDQRERADREARRARVSDMGAFLKERNAKSSD